jgi:glycosyltransferase involved in cell wall biosynthesis
MAEVVGSAGLLIDPVSPDQIAEAIEAAAGPDHRRLALAGRTQASWFTWERSARAHADVYRELA